MNRTLANLIIDLIAALLFFGMIATGYLLRFTLPPGTNKGFSLWGYSRHQWGDIHFWISMGLLTVLTVHLVIHWNWIVTVIGKRCHPGKSAQPSLLVSGLVTLGAIIMLFMLFAWTAQHSVQKIAGHERRAHFAASGQVAQARVGNSQAAVDFRTEIYPIFENNCLSCHGPQKQFGHFRVDRSEDLFADNGGPALIVPGRSRESRLFAVISSSNKADRHTLPETDLVRIKAWIDAGALWTEQLGSERQETGNGK